MKLLEQLTCIPSTSGDESDIRNFLKNFFEENEALRQSARVYAEDLQDNLVVRIGKKPRLAVFVHTDTVGYTAGHNDLLIPIGSPAGKAGDRLTGKDDKGPVSARIQQLDPDDKKKFTLKASRPVQPGTLFTYRPDFRTEGEFFRSPYMDNRLGIYIALKLAETVDNFIIAFTTYEEHGSGGAQVCGNFISEKFNIHQSLILDATWVTQNVKHGGGPAVSLRDKGIPRQGFVNRILETLNKSELNFQIEVEAGGASDGMALQQSHLPFDWCFIGPAVKNPHSPLETVMKSDIEDSVKVYRFLIENFYN